jgi:hypothetical protein
VIDLTKKKSEKPTDAKSIAGAMVANMTANQNDPNWEIEHERINQESAAKALKKNEKALKEAGISIPKKNETK